MRSELPLSTADLPGCGGRMLGGEDFEVEEIPAYLPAGQGEHCLALLRKRNLTTPQALERVCRALGLDPGAAGYAGLKDRNAVTSQWFSFHKAAPEQLLGLDEPDLQILQAGLHVNKIRTGHLKGNRFSIVIRETDPDGEARARAVLERLVDQGLPNYFGEQRFGRRGDNALVGLRMLRGEIPWPRQRFQGRLLVSAVQSALFNAVLARRLDRGCVRQLLGGEVLSPRGSHGLFVSEALPDDQARLDRGEVVITGPICGPRMPWPAEGSPARALEEEAIAEQGVSPALFAEAGRLGRGGRRPLTIEVAEARVEPLPPTDLRLRFSLPPGSYATVLLREVMKVPVLPMAEA